MIQNFKEFISNIKSDELDKKLEKAKEERKRGKKKARNIIITINGIIALALLVIVYKTNMYSLIALPFVIVFTIIIDVIISVACTHNEDAIKYNEIFKEQIVSGILKNFFDEIDYVPKKWMPREIYNKATGEVYDTYYSDDYVEGLVDSKYKITMANITTKEIREEKDSKGNVQKKEYIIFTGLFSKINLKKSINSNIIVAESPVYREARDTLDPLRMDSSEFQKYFNTVTNNKIIAMQILTPDIMEMLINFKKDAEAPFDVIIDEDVMYIRLRVGEIFEADVNDKTTVDDKLTEEYFNIVKFIYNLTTKIIQVIDDTEI